MSEQTLLVAYQQYLLKDGFNSVRVATDKAGNARKVRHRIAGQSLEDNIVLTLPLNLATGGDALRVSKQNNLEQYGGVIGLATAAIVVVLVVESRQVNMVINEVMQREFEGAGLDLLFEIDHNHRILIVIIGFEVGHAAAPWSDT